VADDELTPEKLAEQIRLLKIEDILLSTVTTLSQLAYAKLEAKELAQAQLAIDAIAAVLPTLEGHVGADTLRDFKQVLANVRLSFANTVSASGSEPQTPGGAGSTPSEDAAETPKGHETEAEASQESGSGSEPQSPGAENRGDG
jgi:hypothetical protein